MSWLAESQTNFLHNLINIFVNSKKSAQFKFSVASPRGANQKMVQHDTG